MMKPEEDVVKFVLGLIRTQYLQARPPQQIKELKNLFPENIVIREKTAPTASTGDQLTGTGKALDIYPIRKTCTSDNESGKAAVVVGEGLKEGDLDGLGNKTESVTIASANVSSSNAVKVGGKEEEGNIEKSVSSSIITIWNGEVLEGLYDVTVGYPPPPPLLAADEGAAQVVPQEQNKDETFLHPPIHYRISFAKYIIKQLEMSGNWSAPQGSNEEDEGDPSEQKALLLEKWYAGLESLSSNISSSRQPSSEPFYRLYEIKVAHYNRKGSSGTTTGDIKGEIQTASRTEMVKMFENETSFVADGTTGLVTWEASTEFLKWLTSSKSGAGAAGGDGRFLLEKIGEGKDIEWVLELGCGCGFLAIGLCKCLVPGKVRQYIATDGSLAALEKAKQNVEANFSETDNDGRLIRNRIRFEKVEWRNEETRESFTQLVDGMTCIYGADKGLLLGADIVFDPEMIPDLVTLILSFLEAKAGKVILACTIRNEKTLDCLKAELDKSHLVTTLCGKWENGEILDICLQ